MKRATIAVCLLVLTAGCIVQTGDDSSNTVTVSTPDRIDDKAESPSNPSTPSAGAYEIDVEEIEDVFHMKINRQRKSQNVDPLNRSTKLDAIARYKSWDMANRNYYAHKGPGGVNHNTLREKYDSDCRNIGQNLMKDPKGAKYTELSGAGIEAWSDDSVSVMMNSSGHRQNILDPDYEVQGIGVFVDENGTLYLTQEFCG